MQNKSSKIAFDTASVITVAGIILFQFGWLYWSVYFTYLNIDTSFVEMSFSKIIATTWFNILTVCFCFAVSLRDMFLKQDLKMSDAVITTLLTIAVMIYGFLDSPLYKAILFGTAISASTLIVYYTKNKRDHFFTISLTRNLFSKLILTELYIFSLIYYPIKAITDSNKFYKEYNENIQVELKADNKIVSGKLISHMDSKYFILVRGKQNIKNVAIFNDDDIASVNIIEKHTPAKN